jgi:tRNA-specific adenosine deaminase 3
MEIARQLGQSSASSGCGKSIGALIIDPKSQRIVAGAGDARFHDFPLGNASAPLGNVLAHAALRAISIVGNQRVALREQCAKRSPSNTFATQSPIYVDAPLSTLEHSLVADSPLEYGGYLCTNLDIYLTHEPCVMCSMAILHSRFGRVIFGKETASGGIAAERKGTRDDGKEHAARYGLWYRSELNWRMMAWQWVDEEEPDGGEDGDFHA